MNSDHRDNIGTHPAYSQDPETRLRARLDVAYKRAKDTEAAYRKARAELNDFLLQKASQS